MKLTQRLLMRQQTVTSFHPSSLFGGSDVGACWDFTDATKLYTDQSGTTPVSTDGDGVMCAEDISGQGRNLIAAASANALLYRVGSPAYIEGASTSRYLLLNLPSAIAYPITMMIAGNINGIDKACGLIISDNDFANKGLFLFGDSAAYAYSPTIAVYNTSYSEIGITDTKTNFVAIADFLSGSQTVTDHDGTTSSALNVSCPSGLQNIGLGGWRRSTGVSYYPGNYACAMIIDRQLTAQEKIDLFAWASVRAGA
jgi:hypothetical protein